jgi:hypothetical protein
MKLKFRTVLNYKVILNYYMNKENTKVKYIKNLNYKCCVFLYIESEKLLFSLKEILVN